MIEHMSQVVLSTFVEQAENISLEELEYDLMEAPQPRASFAACLAEAMRKVLADARGK
jgi:hypothetical protein